MINKFLISVSIFIFSNVFAVSNIYELNVITLSGQNKKMSEYKGKVLLIVNVASGCGFDPQMKDLEDLYKKYKKDGFEVLAFPSNDFKQESLSGAELQKRNEDKYGVTFSIMDKASVKGSDKQPIYQYLTESKASLLGREVKWNFEKFLVGRDGQVIDRWNSMKSPSSPDIIKAIEQALGQK